MLALFINFLVLSFLFSNVVNAEALISKLKGKIVLKVEDSGKAYYIHPETNQYR